MKSLPVSRTVWGEPRPEEEATMASKEETEKTAAEFLESALEDLNEARLQAEHDLRAAIDSAIARAREALDDVRSDAGDRAERLRGRLDERAEELQSTLEEVPEDARRELGVRSVRAQRTEEALKAMSDAIAERRKEMMD
ncbi:MAG: hypothetical protein ACXWFN_05325 [Solirubrobacterales bacterium]